MRLATASCTPESRTFAARPENSADSTAGRPNSLTSSAPDTPKRSVIVEDMSALRPMRRRDSAASRRAMLRSSTTNTGITSSESSVTFHESASIAPSVNASVNRSDATLADVPTVWWAPSTSVDSRDISAPVCVRLKNAIGIRCTWSYSATRRS